MKTNLSINPAIPTASTSPSYPITVDPIAQQAYLKASNTEAGDGFGESVSVFGDTVVVGAPREDSSATGVNGNQTDNSASNSGAAYVFIRSGTTWTQQAYEVFTGKLPLDPLSKPALVAVARTAIEFVFPAAIGKTYRIEASTDLEAWETVESGIVGM